MTIAQGPPMRSAPPSICCQAEPTLIERAVSDDTNDVRDALNFNKSSQIHQLTSKLDALVESNSDIATKHEDVVCGLEKITQQLQAVASAMAKEEATMEKQQEALVKLEEEMEAGGPVQHRLIVSHISVQIVASVERIFDLNTIDQTFCVQVLTTLQWRCPKNENPPAPEEDDGDWEPEWTPKFRYRNIIEIMLETQSYQPVDINGVKWVRGEMRTLMKITEPLELTSFPCDCQDLHVSLESKMSVEQVKWVPFQRGEEVLPAGRVLKERCLLNDFRLVNESPYTHNMFVAQLEDKQVASLEIVVKVVRKANFYILNVAVIMFFIISFVFCAWGLHPGDIGGRQSIDFNLILTVVAFKIFLGGMLPAVSYVTRMDIYVMVGFAFLVVITAVHSTMPYTQFMKMDLSAITLPPLSFPETEEADLIDQDNLTFYFFLGLWGLWNVCFSLWLWVKARNEYAQFSSQAIADQKMFDESHSELINKSGECMQAVETSRSTRRQSKTQMAREQSPTD